MKITDKPEFFRHWKFYLLGKSFDSETEDGKITGSNYPFIGAVSGGLGAVIFIFFGRVFGGIGYLLSLIHI